MLNNSCTAKTTPGDLAGSQPISLNDVYAAQDIIQERLQPTPLVSNPVLSAALGFDAQVKLENSHDIGSFKIRGGLNLLAAMPEKDRARGLVTATRGNHGQSLAYAAKVYDVPCTVFVPVGNNADKNAAMTAMGATVVEDGHDFDAAWAASERFAAMHGARSVHPAEEPELVAGVATAALEMLEQSSRRFDTVFVPIGGGSIACGTALVFKSLSPQTRIVGVQAENAPAHYHAWQSGEIKPFVVTETIADGLAVRNPAEFTFHMMRALLDDVLLVSEEEIYAAIRCYASTIHQMAEGAGAVSLAGAIQQKESLAGQNVGMVLTGGNIEAHTLVNVLTEGTPSFRPQAMPMFPISEINYGY